MVWERRVLREEQMLGQDLAAWRGSVFGRRGEAVKRGRGQERPTIGSAELATARLAGHNGANRSDMASRQCLRRVCRLRVGSILGLGHDQGGRDDGHHRKEPHIVWKRGYFLTGVLLLCGLVCVLTGLVSWKRRERGEKGKERKGESKLAGEARYPRPSQVMRTSYIPLAASPAPPHPFSQPWDSAGIFTNCPDSTTSAYSRLSTSHSKATTIIPG
jgi:hypothetical protein